MQAKISHNTREIRARMERRGPAVARELRHENVGIARDLTAGGKRELDADVYSIAEKTNPRTGRKLWVRTGRLKNEDRWVAVGMAVVHKNAAPHYLHRLRYGRGGRPASPPQKASNWPRTTVIKQARSIRVRRRAAIARGWRLAGG